MIKADAGATDPVTRFDATDNVPYKITQFLIGAGMI